MKTTFDKSLLFTGALCAALVCGCSDSGAAGAAGKETAKPAAPAVPAKAPEAAGKPAPAANTGAGLTAAATDAAKKAGDAAAAGVAAVLDKVPTQEDLDAAAAKTISSANEDAEFEKLAKEIEKSDGN